MGSVKTPYDRTIVIGDVHGCLIELELLLKKLAFNARTDRCLFLGDLVAKGPDSLGVLHLAQSIGARSILGNHEAAVLSILRGTTKPKGPHETIAKSLDKDSIEYIESMPLWLELGEFWLVHGGLLPGKHPSEMDRHDLLTMRSLDEHGQASKKWRPRTWAADWTGPRHVLFGHDARSGLQRHPFATGLDSGCVYGNALSASILETGEIVQQQATKCWLESAKETS